MQPSGGDEQQQQVTWTYHSPEEQQVSLWTLELAGRRIRVAESPVGEDGRVTLYVLVNEEEARSHCDAWRRAKEDEGWLLVRSTDEEDEEQTVAVHEDEKTEATAAEEATAAGEATAAAAELTAEPDFAVDPEFADGVDLGAEPERHEMAAVAHPRAAEFFSAIRAGELPRVRQILDEGVPAEAVDEEGTQPLHVAAAAGQVEIVDCLIQETAADVDAADASAGRTPLIRAVESGSAAAAAHLLEARADVHHRDRQGRTALAYAVERGDRELERILREAGAEG